MSASPLTAHFFAKRVGFFAPFVLFVIGCSGSSTQQLLNLDFLKADTYLTIETESLVNSGQNFHRQRDRP